MIARAKSMAADDSDETGAFHLSDEVVPHLKQAADYCTNDSVSCLRCPVSLFTRIIAAAEN